MGGAVTLLSGGLDSTVGFKRALDHGGIDLAVTFDYGQRAAESEMGAAAQMCLRYGVEHRVIELPWLADGDDSALLKQGPEPPLPSQEDLDDVEGAAAEWADCVWVANRNGVFLNVAAAFAEKRGASEVVVGFNAEEGATFPDNTADPPKRRTYAGTRRRNP